MGAIERVPTQDDGPVDVAAILDQSRFRGLPVAVAAFAVCALVFDGFDIQTIAFVAPALTDDWQIDRSQLGSVLAAGLVGMAVGALMLGSYGDRRGRRGALRISMIVIGVGSLACAYSEGPSALTLSRFLTGIGLGGSLPNATALLVEFAPSRLRNLLVAVMAIGVPVGGMIGAEVSARTLPLFGWQSVFVIGAILPAILVLGMWWLLPESPRFLAYRPPRYGELARILNRVSGSARFRATDQFMVVEPKAVTGRTGVAAIFAPEYRRDTLLIWSIFFASVFAVFAFVNWLPTILSGIGVPLTAALRGALLFNLGGVVGAVLGALAMTRLGSKPVLAFMCVVAAASSGALGFMSAHIRDDSASEAALAAFFFLVSTAGFSIIALQVGMYSVAANAYPTESRASGVGWALGVARLGGIISSFAGGALLAIGHGMSPFFFGIAVVLTFALLGVLLLRRHMRAIGRLVPYSGKDAADGQ